MLAGPRTVGSRCRAVRWRHECLSSKITVASFILLTIVKHNRKLPHAESLITETTMSNTQSWSPDKYAENARFVSELGAPVVELLAPRAGEKILDLGCGDGALTVKLASMGCAVIGVDASAAQVDAARKLGVDARVMD